LCIHQYYKLKEKKNKRKTIFKIKEKEKEKKRNNDLASLPSHDSSNGRGRKDCPMGNR